MKPIPFKIPKSSSKGLRYQIDEGKSFYNKFHYHPEYQLTVIEKGVGILHGGKKMVQFQPGDVFLIGANVPHIFKNSPEYYTDDSPGVLAYSIFFQKTTFGDSFFDIDEMVDFRNLLEDSKRGIKINGRNKNSVFFQVKSFPRNKKGKAIIQFLSLLSLIHEGDKEYINDEPFFEENQRIKDERLNDILAYTFQHQHEPISIEEIAKIAGLSRSQFSRYFKSSTGKTYIEFINEYRVESACTLLSKERMKIDRICFEVGFQNLSHFNRVFKRLKGMSPSQFRKNEKHR